jgi:hypothetical protein
MPKRAELTLEEGISIYKMLLKKFSIEELEGKIEETPKAVVTQEEFNKFFEENILSQVDPSKTIFPNKNSFSKIKLFNSNGEWLFEYNTDPENSYFWYQFDRVYLILRDKFSLQDSALQALMKSLVESHFKMKGITPYEEYRCRPQW